MGNGREVGGAGRKEGGWLGRGGVDGLFPVEHHECLATPECKIETTIFLDNDSRIERTVVYIISIAILRQSL